MAVRILAPALATDRAPPGCGGGGHIACRRRWGIRSRFLPLKTWARQVAALTPSKGAMAMHYPNTFRGRPSSALTLV
jgi:hypothetical protein